MMKYLTYLTVGLFLTALLSASGEARTATAERLKIEFDRNPNLLPCFIEKLRYTDSGVRFRQIEKPLRVYRSGRIDESNRMYIEAFNKPLNQDAPSAFLYVDAENGSITRQVNIYHTITDYCVFPGRDAGGKGILAGCYRNDSAFAFSHRFESNQRSLVHLTSGIDRTGDGEWVPGIGICAKTDYDYDGKTEVFLYLTSSFDEEPRILYCIEPDSPRVEWALPVASSIVHGPLSCGDSLNPSVVFVTYGPQNGVTDQNFNDSFGYLVKVNGRGKVLFRRVISADFQAPALSSGGEESKSNFYLYHPLPFVHPDSTNSLPQQTNLLTVIGSNCETIGSVPVDEALSCLWLSDYTDDGENELYTLSVTGTIRIYDDQLSLLAESNQTNLSRFIDTLRVAGLRGTCFIFCSSVKTTDIYSNKMVRLASYDMDFVNFEPLAFDAAANVSQLVLTSPNKFMIAKIGRRSVSDYAQILFWEYREYVLATLSALIVGLVLVNHYRRKTETNLSTIARQKKELERVYEELKAAQARVIAQEKLQQAKEIAGGVAHEIHNALCPALNSLDKLRQRLDPQEGPESDRNRVLLSLTERAIDRAVKMTDLVRTYSQLESEKRGDRLALREIVEEVVDSNRLRIEQTNADVQTDIPDDCTLRCAHIHAFSFLNNLMLNALDALVGGDERRISIRAQNIKGRVKIEFADAGAGIPQDRLGRIFDAFYSTKPHSGTGLGLTVARRIINLYDGSIDVESTVDKGTKFTILLPASN